MTDARPQVILTQEFENLRVQVLLSLFADAQREIERIIAKKPDSAFTQARLRDLNRQIEIVLDEVARKATELGDKNTRKVFDEAVKNASARLAGFGAQGSVNLGSVLNTSAVAAAADAYAADIAFALDSTKHVVSQYLRAAQLDTIVNRQITRNIGTGFAAGSNLRDTTRTVAGTIVDSGASDGRFVKIGNKQFRLDYYAELVTRTRMREVASLGTINTVLAFGEDLVQVSVHEHPQLDPCTPFIGRVYSISGQAGDFPKLEERPPFHPHCRHVLLPITREAMELDGEYDELARISNQKVPDSLTTKGLKSFRGDVISSYKGYRGLFQ